MISAEAGAVMPTMIAYLETANKDDPSLRIVLNCLEEMGSSAKQAIPAVENIAAQFPASKEDYRGIGSRSREALKRMRD